VHLKNEHGQIVRSTLMAAPTCFITSPRFFTRQLNAAAGELDVTARWGIAGKDGVCMPSKGRLTERPYAPGEREAMIARAAALGLDEAAAFACLGESTFDVHWNDVGAWRNVPADVGLHAGRVSGHQEMAFVPREGAAGPGVDAGRGCVRAADDPPHRCAGVAAPRRSTRTTGR
jgi:hypothetical protein